MAGKKRVEDLREDANIQTVKLHFHRFGKFLRYLKQQDAVIELTFPGENGAGNHKQVYTASKRDGNPSIEDLLAEALNISGSLAREYTSRKLGIDDKHSDGDKIYATGKVIDAITFYTAGSDSIDESTDLLATPNAFRVRTLHPLESGFSYTKPESDIRSNFEDPSQAFNALTIGATALASNFAAELYSEYPDYWPETIRGLMIHSADWTGEMTRGNSIHPDCKHRCTESGYWSRSLYSG